MTMSQCFLRLLVLPLAFALWLAPAARAGDYVLAIHGGAGGSRGDEAGDAATRAGLARALAAGKAVLAQGGAARAAVVAAIQVMEDDPAFNAGRGAVLDARGEAALDVSLMDGRDLAVGAATGLRRVKNPILLANLILERGPHVMYAGKGAEDFAHAQGMRLVKNAYFVTPQRRLELQRLRRARATPKTDKPGTVGAVALDTAGNLAAGTSTGGLAGKAYGRVGDSPIIGAGTYAANGVCAVSATGDGEYFIRATAARDICARIEFLKENAATAAETVLNGKIKPLGGLGGVIVIDGAGGVAMPYNTGRMARAVARAGAAFRIALYPEDGA
ncbi:MAG: isoaspartyl peptidase/L-asparaginase family protein [Pseudomonadota bacterium]